MSILPQKTFEFCPKCNETTEHIGGTCMECVKKCHTQPKAIAVKGDGTSFIFYVETTGTLTVERVVSQAVKILIGELEKFVKAVKGVSGDSN